MTHLPHRTAAPRGRRPATALGVLTTGALALGSFSNPLFFYWILFVLALQRGPILPCQQELEEPMVGLGGGRSRGGQALLQRAGLPLG